MRLIEEYRRYMPRRLNSLLKGRRGEFQSTIEKSIRVPNLPISRPKPGTVWAVSMVRNEEDVVDVTVRHLLDQAIDGVIIVDNLSSDATPDILSDLARNSLVHVGRDVEPAYYQGEKMSFLAHLAWRAGAEWIVPFDADEHWYAPDSSLGNYLRTCEAPVQRATMHDVLPVPGNKRLEFAEGATVRVDRTPSSYVKVAFRAESDANILTGNHEVTRAGKRAEGLHLLHYQWRSEAQLVRKVRQGAAAIRDATKHGGIGLHWTSMDQLDTEDLAGRWRLLLEGGGGTPDEPPRELVDVESPWLRWRTWDPQDVVD